MNQSERRLFLIEALLAERSDGKNIQVPADADSQRRLLRALMNVRPPKPLAPEVLDVQDAYLAQRLVERGGATRIDTLAFRDRIAVWRGDITLLAADAIVNAANDQMLGCFVPGHSCIDNAIHTYAGMQLRGACSQLMDVQGHAEPTGRVKVTPAYNLPSRYVFHTVGPIVASHNPGPREELLLRRCSPRAPTALPAFWWSMSSGRSSSSAARASSTPSSCWSAGRRPRGPTPSWSCGRRSSLLPKKGSKPRGATWNPSELTTTPAGSSWGFLVPRPLGVPRLP